MNMKKVNPILNKIIESLTKSFHRIMNMVTTITIDIQKVWGFISKLLFYATFFNHAYSLYYHWGQKQDFQMEFAQLQIVHKFF